MHRFYSQTITTNSSGHFVFECCPNEVLDSVANKSCTLYSADAAYNPASASSNVAGVTVDTRPWYNLTNGTARSVRLVAMSISATSLSTSLNRKGTMYGALLSERPFASAAYGATTTLYWTIPSIQNSWHKRANIFNGEGVCVNYLPSDEDDLAFLAPNTECQNRHTNNDDVYWMVIIGQSLEISSAVRIDVNLHYEIIPQPESSLAGIESTAPTQDTIPALDIAHIKAYHTNDLIRVVNAYDNATENTLGVRDVNSNRSGNNSNLISNLTNIADIGLSLVPGGNLVSRGIRAAKTGYDLYKNYDQVKKGDQKPYKDNKYGHYRPKKQGKGGGQRR